MDETLTTQLVYGITGNNLGKRLLSTKILRSTMQQMQHYNMKMIDRESSLLARHMNHPITLSFYITQIQGKKIYFLKQTITSKDIYDTQLPVLL